MIALARVFGDRRAQGARHDFVARYRKGAPWDGYTDQEVLERYRQVAPRLTPAEFELVAQAAMERFSPQDRQLFGRYLQQQAQWQGRQIADLGGNATENRFRDADILGTILARIHCRRDTGLEQLVCTQDNCIDSLLAKGALAGIVAAATRNGFGGTDDSTRQVPEESWEVPR